MAMERYRLKQAIRFLLHTQVVIVRNGNVVEGLLRWDTERLCFMVNDFEFYHDQLKSIDCNRITLTE